MKHGSLFSGIGGFDLAADWMGWENIFHCEIAEFPRKILNHYWPNADCHEDIKKTDFTKYRGTVDIISGGFPCQPYSAAGKRLGKEDDRHLWPEMLRVIREVKPQWVVGENVRGLLNWNGGMVFHEVCSDLENIGYEVQAFIIPASGINAPHQRERLWIVANSRHNAERKTASSITNEGEQSSIIHTSEQSRNKSAIFNNGFCDLQRDVADTDNTRTNNGMQSNGEWKENDEQRRGQSQSEHWENGINGITSDSQSYGRKTDERINNGTKYKSNDRDTIRNIFNTDGKQRDVADTDSNGFDKRNGNNEINASERGFNALNDINQSNGIGNAPDTESQRTREQSSENRGWEDGRFNDISEDGDATYTDSIRLERECGPIGELEREIRFSSTSSRNMYDTAWDNFPTQSPVCGGDDGISNGLDNITFSKWRNESIKGYGNAVVPQVVYRIFKTIEYIQNLKE
jgi:DNA (cytosine-5)-methyltransferase 1